MILTSSLFILYIFAVNYVRGANIPSDEERAQNIMGYIAEKVSDNYRVTRDVGEDSLEDRESRQQPLFPRLSWQYHNYTR